MKNKHLKKAIEIACRMEGIAPTTWARKTEGMNATRIVMLPKENLGPEKMAILCNPKNWKNPKSAADILIAALNDRIEDYGRSTEEFSVSYNAGNKANIPLEQNIRTLEEFARDNSGAVELIARLASMVKQMGNAANNEVKRPKIDPTKVNPMKFDGAWGEKDPTLSSKSPKKANKIKQ